MSFCLWWWQAIFCCIGTVRKDASHAHSSGFMTNWNQVSLVVFSNIYQLHKAVLSMSSDIFHGFPEMTPLELKWYTLLQSSVLALQVISAFLIVLNCYLPFLSYAMLIIYISSNHHFQLRWCITWLILLKTSNTFHSFAAFSWTRLWSVL